MLRKEAIVRAAMVAHTKKQMQMDLLTIESCYRTPTAVLHLSLEQLRFQPKDVLLQILNTIWMAKPSAFSTLMYYNNSVIKKFC